MGSAYQFHSWRVFVVVCALPCVSAVVALTFMPESPRFYLEVRERQYTGIQAVLFSLLMTLIMTLKKNTICVLVELLVFHLFLYVRKYAYILQSAYLQRFLKL